MAIHVCGTFRIVEGKEAIAESILKKYLEDKVESEKGTLVFSIYRSTSNPRQWIIYEKYADEDATKYHLSLEQRNELNEAMSKENLLEDGSFEGYELLMGVHEKPE